MQRAHQRALGVVLVAAGALLLGALAIHLVALFSFVAPAASWRLFDAAYDGPALGDVRRAQPDFESELDDGSGAASASQSVEGRVSLHLPREPITASTLRFEGVDPAAPRALVLWRFDGERHSAVARARSQPDGRVDFGLLPLALVGADYWAGGESESPPRDGLARVVRAVPPPHVARSPDRDDEISVVTARAEGELWLRDAREGTLFARIAIEPDPRARATFVDLARALPRQRPESIAIEHVLPDGRRSPPEVLAIRAAGR